MDARAGITPFDHHFAQWLRKRIASNRKIRPSAPSQSSELGVAGRADLKRPYPVVLIANKAESASLASEAGLNEAYELGFGDPVIFSAEHGEGYADLHQRLVEAMLEIVRYEEEVSLKEQAEVELETTVPPPNQQQQQQQGANTPKPLSATRSIATVAGPSGSTVATGEPIGVKTSDLIARFLSDDDAVPLNFTPVELEELENRFLDHEMQSLRAANRQSAHAEGREPLYLAIAGKPNVGKSTLTNALLGYERCLTAPEPGVTRDAIAVKWIQWSSDAPDAVLPPNVAQKKDDDQTGESLLGKPKTKRRGGGRKGGADDSGTAALIKMPSLKELFPTFEKRDQGSDSAADTPGSDTPMPDRTYDFMLVDTAGLKGTSGIKRRRYSKVDRMAMEESLKAIERANVVALVIDATDGLDLLVDTLIKHEGAFDADEWSSQYGPRTISNLDQDKVAAARFAVEDVMSHDDLAIARRIVDDQGKALVIVANKWDQVPLEKQRTVMYGLQDLFQRILAQAKGVPILPMSALKSDNLDLLVPYVIRQYNRYPVCSIHKACAL